jgi:hypothetical protein
MKTLNTRLKLIFAMLPIALLSSLIGLSQKAPISPVQERVRKTTVIQPAPVSPVQERLRNLSVIKPAPKPRVSVIQPAPRPTPVIVAAPRRHHSRGWIPPGQAKKMYGTKSAKPFAPGQQKK